MNELIRQLIAQHFTVAMPELAIASGMQDDMHLLNDLGADSMDILELVGAVEFATDLTAPNERVLGITTVRHLLVNDGCSHPSKGIGCSKIECHVCEFQLIREAA